MTGTPSLEGFNVEGFASMLKVKGRLAKRNEMKRNKMTAKPLEHHTSQISVCDTLNEQKTTGSAEFLKFKYICISRNELCSGGSSGRVGEVRPRPPSPFHIRTMGVFFATCLTPKFLNCALRSPRASLRSPKQRKKNSGEGKFCVTWTRTDV